jgi:hypothetical protein
VAYRPADAQTVRPPRRAEGKPQSEVEALRKEVELLRLNLLVVLEKVRAQEAELSAFRGQRGPAAPAPAAGMGDYSAPKTTYSAPKTTTGVQPGYGSSMHSLGIPDAKGKRPAADPARQIEDTLKALRDARDDASRQRLLDALERALRRLHDQPRQPRYTAPGVENVPPGVGRPQGR